MEEGTGGGEEKELSPTEKRSNPPKGIELLSASRCLPGDVTGGWTFLLADTRSPTKMLDIISGSSQRNWLLEVAGSELAGAH